MTASRSGWKACAAAIPATRTASSSWPGSAASRRQWSSDCTAPTSLSKDSVFDHEALTRLAVEAGLDRDEAAAVLAGDSYGDHVDTDEAMAQALGATGVPLFVIDRKYGISGAQPAETITRVLEQAWSEAGR